MRSIEDHKMAKQVRDMGIKYPEVGVCGLSCRVCPRYHTKSESKCLGCKTESRITAGCPFITCAVKKNGIEFCWDCEENASCEKWKTHRAFGKQHDTFRCYQKLEDNISLVEENGVGEFERLQKNKEGLLKEMLQDFNEGRSKSYYCIAATVLEIDELRKAISTAKRQSAGLQVREKSKVLHSLLDTIAERMDYSLKSRK